MANGYNLCVVGCGTMGVAILSGVLDSLAHPSVESSSRNGAAETPDSSAILDPQADSSPANFVTTVNREESIKRLNKVWRETVKNSELHVDVVAGDNVGPVSRSDVILLCCKPQMAQSILQVPGMSEALAGKLVISILAGTRLEQLHSWLPSDTRVIRAMPNTPCKIREGMTVISNVPTGPNARLDRAILSSLFTPIGRVRFLDEKYFDACTALSGSGPAFACLMLEAMADGGVMMGLPRSEALELAAQTMQGAARMVLKSGAHPAAIKDSVTTPGGCTIAGLLTLEDGRVRSTIARCIQTATEHASGLGQATTGKR
ncbi:uncharacterized protein L969DRAFT_94290 [Mixia osmundae IAM 14324]|uniref:Pyrroline-5-carboxylate reductase n=1 Tax=Mixia osmundae (strain CBS 9802 / IAM 14324 / JCM 22182 / KY 12970) TaxID=764103 RepID=G7E8E9_MIXOS|nr:uncharacterized protein L969DRAFT_94290 [Mixia osmundae IAM 14324]KEI39211.1 hypothetical protein L969DRAFT_94290 [Mixia osmundae IAM 14324]GAA99109.1 hypothetical protein E5Q_05798 [Mixia osmundae IAM 14324]